MTTGPSAHRPKQPVWMILISSCSPHVEMLSANACWIALLPEEVQPVPPQIRT